MANREHVTRETTQNKHEEGRKSRNVFWGAVLGGVVGAAAALLLAPKSGKELRGKLNNQATTLLDKKGEIASIAKEKAVALTKSLVQKSTDFVEKAKNFSVKPEETTEAAETNYITLEDPDTKKDQQKLHTVTSMNETDIRRKLEETRKALEDEESKRKHE